MKFTDDWTKLLIKTLYFFGIIAFASVLMTGPPVKNQPLAYIIPILMVLPYSAKKYALIDDTVGGD